MSGASIQLYAAGTSGYGSGATALLTTTVSTDASGAFTITGDYTCPTSTSQLYIVATGGNPGLTAGTNNPALALMAALGPCSLYNGQYTLNPSSFISINEATTVASVYALRGFMMTGSSQIGSSSANASTGLANAFQTVNNFVSTTSGAVLATTPAGNGTVPQAAIDSLANSIATCVNSDGTGSPCASLFTAATPSGGTAPTDTIQALFDIASNPVHNAAALYALAQPTPPFQPTLSGAPNDWSLPIVYLVNTNAPVDSLAIDSTGNVWTANSIFNGPYSVNKVASTGAVLSGANGYSVGSLVLPNSIAIDPTGNAWVTGTGAVIKLSSSGALLSGASGYTGGGLNHPSSIAIDGQGSAWVLDSGAVIKLSSTGSILSGATGWSTGSSSSPAGIGMDGAGNAWAPNGFAQTIVEFANDGTVLSGPNGFATPGVNPLQVQFDSTGDVWVSSFQNGGVPTSPIVVAELASNGTSISPSGGYDTCVSRTANNNTYNCFYPNTFGLAVDGAGIVWNTLGTLTTPFHGGGGIPAYGVTEVSHAGTVLSGLNGITGGLNLGAPMAVDAGGNLWMVDGYSLAEYVGLASPLATPFSLGVKNGTLGKMP